MIIMLLDDFRKKASWLYVKDDALHLFRALCSDASLCMILYRGMSYCNRYWVTKPIAAIFCKLNALLCGAVIGRGASFGKNFVILHSVGIVVNSKVVGGDDITLESGVVIGEEKQGCPTLGDNIFIGSGAKLFGSIHLGNNVKVGANAVVNRSFPDNTVIGGVPAELLRHVASDNDIDQRPV